MFIKVLQVLDWASSHATCVEYSRNNAQQAEMLIQVDNIVYIKASSRDYRDGTTRYALIRMVGGNDINITDKYDEFVDKITKLASKPVRNLITARSNV